MKERRYKLYARLIRKCAAIEDLFYSSRNIRSVQEEMCQFNDQLKLQMSLHEEFYAMLEEEEKIESDEWIDMMDEQVFNFKRRVHTWLKNAEEDREVYSPTKAIHQKDLLLRQAAVANQMFQRDQVVAINLITPKQEH